MQLRSTSFESYARNLRRVYWAEFVENQMYAPQVEKSKLPLLPPFKEFVTEDDRNSVEVVAATS